MKITGFSVFFGLVLAALPAAAAGLPSDLAAAAKAFDKAQLEGDGAALNRLLADDYTLVNSRGLVESKADFIADYTAAGFKLHPFTIRQPVEKVWPNGAVLGGLVTLSGTDGGDAYSATLRFADIWAKRNGHWQVIYTGVTRAPEGTKP